MKIDSKLLFTITIDKELKNGNTGRTKHFSQAIKEKKQWVQALSVADVETETGIVLPLPAFIEDILNGQPIAQKVGIAVRRVLGKRQRQWDADSILRGNFKECLDSVVGTGLLSDDNTKHVAWCVGLQDDTRKSEGPFVELDFYGAE